MNYYDQAKELKDIKKDSELSWFKEVPAQCLQQALMDLDKAFKSFWRSGFGFPKFKKKGRSDSFRFPDPKQFELKRINKNRGLLKLPKIGEVFFRFSRQIEGKIKNATVKRESDGWYVSFSAEEEILLFELKNGSEVGIDRGIAQTGRTSKSR